MRVKSSLNAAVLQRTAFSAALDLQNPAATNGRALGDQAPDQVQHFEFAELGLPHRGCPRRNSATLPTPQVAERQEHTASKSVRPSRLPNRDPTTGWPVGPGDARRRAHQVAPHAEPAGA